MVTHRSDAYKRVAKFLTMRGVVAPRRSRLSNRPSSVYHEEAVYELNGTDLSALLSQIDNLTFQLARAQGVHVCFVSGEVRV